MTMNILFLTHYDNFYGSSRSLMSLLKGLQEYDIKPFVVIPKLGGFTDALSEQNITYKITALPWWVNKKKLSTREKFIVVKKNFRSVKTIRQLVQEWQIDVIYTNSSVIAVGRLAAMLEGVPYIWHIREFGDLDWSLGFIFPEWMSKLLLKSSDAVICHAKVVRDYWFSHPTKHIHQVYNGSATMNQFDQRLEQRKKNQNHDRFVFAMLSAISSNKGQEKAIRALAVLKQKGYMPLLVLAGTGKKDYMAHLKQLVIELDIHDQVDFLGFVNDPYEVYFDADCALICSEHEAFSRVGLEAMSTALPLIGKNSGGNPEIILHEETGFLYDSFDSLVECMIRMVKNPEWSRELGLAGWKRAKEKFNIEDYAANVYNVIESLVNKP